MKYIAVIDTDDYENFKFFEDATGKYLAIKDANAKDGEWMVLPFKEAPEPMRNEMLGVDGFYGGYNYALKDCGILEE